MQRSLKRCYRQDVWNLFLAALCGREKNKVITEGLNSPIPHVWPSVRPFASYATITPLLLRIQILGSNIGPQIGESEGFYGLGHFTPVNTGMVLYIRPRPLAPTTCPVQHSPITRLPDATGLNNA